MIYVRVEPVYLEVIRANPHRAPADLEPIGFSAILDVVEQAAATARDQVLCLESTGTASYFPEFLRRLRAAHPVRLVHVAVPAELGTARVLTPDPAHHIPVSDTRVAEINRIAAQVTLPWDLEIDNSGLLDPEPVVVAIRQLLVQG